jgi:hypothetical protein
VPHPIALLGRTACATLAVAALAAVAGCELLKHNEEATTVINRRAVGMPAGEFFDRFGRPGKRLEASDGSAAYDWVSSVPEAPPGPEGRDDRLCRLKVSVDKRGRISAVEILFDAPGLKSTSRCSEVFAGP